MLGLVCVVGRGGIEQIMKRFLQKFVFENKNLIGLGQNFAQRHIAFGMF
jgi:hypothetical protein